jgi:hypothetical protein
MGDLIAGYRTLQDKYGTGQQFTGFGYNMMSVERLAFFDTIEGAALNTNKWATSVSTMTVTQAGGFINLNPTNSAVSGAYAILQSIEQFWLTGCIPLHFHEVILASLWNLPANTVFEYGWMTCATTAAPTDGVFVRAFNSGGVSKVQLVASFGGVETVSDMKPAFVPTAGVANDWVLNIYGDYATVSYVPPGGTEHISIGRVDQAAGQPALTSANRQPKTLRVYNSGVPGSGGSATLKLGQISVQNRNANFDEPFASKMVSNGLGLYQSPVTTFAQIQNWTNSTEPAAATLSNTAAGYTTLGGQYAFAAPAGAATDFALFGFQVPAGYQAFITDIAITAMNGALNGGAVGATVATTPTTLQWALGVNASAVSLATADGAGTWAPRRCALGSHGFAIGAVVGQKDTDIVRVFGAPKVIDGGRWLHVICRVPIGTATANQIIRGTVDVGGYFT